MDKKDPKDIGTFNPFSSHGQPPVPPTEEEPVGEDPTFSSPRQDPPPHNPFGECSPSSEQDTPPHTEEKQADENNPFGGRSFYGPEYFGAGYDGDRGSFFGESQNRGQNTGNPFFGGAYFNGEQASGDGFQGNASQTGFGTGQGNGFGSPYSANYPPRYQPAKKSGLQTAALILGIASCVVSVLCCVWGSIPGIFCAVAGLITSILAYKKQKNGYTIAALVTSSIGVFFSVIMLLMLALGILTSMEFGGASGNDINNLFRLFLR